MILNRAMRVLHVINSLSGSGGAEQGLVREITRFDDTVDSLVVRLFEADDLEAKLVARGVAVLALNLRSARSGRTWPEAARRVRRHIRAFGPDVIQTSLFIGNLVGQLAAAGTGIPVLSTLTLTGDDKLHKKLQPGAWKTRAATLRRLAALVGRGKHVWYRALTHDTAETNCTSMGIDKSRVTVIPRGVLVHRTAPDRARFGIPANVPLVVNVARIAAQKGQAHLLDAFRQIKNMVPNAHLAIAGRSGDASAAIQTKIAELHLADSVHLLGYRPDVYDLLNSADLFVFSSLAEGLGTAVLEALAVDLPVVAFDVPSIREVTDSGRYARLVPIGDTDQLASASLDILMGHETPSSSAWVSRNFSLDNVALSVQTALERLVKNPETAHSRIDRRLRR